MGRWAVRRLTFLGSGRIIQEAVFQSQIGGVLVQKAICERPCLGVEE